MTEMERIAGDPERFGPYHPFRLFRTYLGVQEGPGWPGNKAPPLYSNILDWWHVGLTEWFHVFLTAAIITVLRIQIQKLVTRIAKNNVKNESARHKYAESMWKCAWYTLSFTSASAVLHAYGWRWMYHSFAIYEYVLPEYFGITRIPLIARLFYTLQLGFYVHSIFAHLFIEVRRSDFWEMLIHHFATVLLIAFSWAFGFYRVGILIVWLHDISDIFLEWAKLYVYTERETAANVVFSVWVLSWVVFRLAYFPFFVLPACIWGYVGHWAWFPFYEIFITLLIVLQALHIIWFFMILKLVGRILSGKQKKVEDTREKED